MGEDHDSQKGYADPLKSRNVPSLKVGLCKQSLWFGHRNMFETLSFCCQIQNSEIMKFVAIGPPSSGSGFTSGSFRFLFSTNPTSRKWIETCQLAWTSYEDHMSPYSTYLLMLQSGLQALEGRLCNWRPRIKTHLKL